MQFSMANGLVYLIGAGPGDPELMTVKGLRYLRQADVVVYDALVNSVLLEEASPRAELIFVGKRAGQPHLSQEAINALLVRLAQTGQIVARLKGGDPFVFGRGGEEAEALRAAGIEYEIVPGISSAVAVPAYAGIPITHRDYASSFTVITGHEDPQRPPDDSRLDWHGLVRLGGTLVFLMGLGRLDYIAARLIEAGQSPLTPAAVIQSGTLAEQITVTAALFNIADHARAAGIAAPAVIVIGNVVNLRDKLSWFEEAKLVQYGEVG